VNLTTLSKRLDRLDDGGAEEYERQWDRFCDSQGEPRINVAGARGIEELLKLYRTDTGTDRS
jgi:hypothetical protein